MGKPMAEPTDPTDPTERPHGSRGCFVHLSERLHGCWRCRHRPNERGNHITVGGPVERQGMDRCQPTVTRPMYGYLAELFAGAHACERSG